MHTFILYLSVVVACAAGFKKQDICFPCKCSKTLGKIIANCSNLGLKDIPSSIPYDVTYLDMSKNKMNELPPYSLRRFNSLRYFDLSKNNLNILDVNSFVGAFALRTLILHGNAIPLNVSAYPKGVFKHQKSLVSLDVRKNVIDTVGVYPDDTISDLISLQTLYVDGVKNATFGQGFARLKNLTTLSLSGRRGYCAICSLLNNSFVNTPLLTFLDISQCSINHIEVKAFEPLISIDILDLSENVYLGFDKFGDSLYGLQFSPLRVLKMNRIVNTFAIGVVIKEDHFRYFENMTVKEVYGDNNRIELFEYGVPAQLKGCEIVSIKNGRFTFGEYLLALNQMTKLREIYFNDKYTSDRIPLPSSEGESAVFNKDRRLCSDKPKSLTDQEKQTLRKKHKSSSTCGQETNARGSHVDLSDTYSAGITESDAYTSALKMLNHNMFSGHNAKQNDSRNRYDALNKNRLTIPMPPNVLIVNASNSKLNYKLYEIRISKNRIKQIDISNNFLTKWMGPFHEIQNLEYLDMSNNYCDEMTPSFLKFATGLKVLNISKNYLAASLSNDTNGQLFFNQTKLEILKVANNIIQTLPVLIFSRLTNLKVLDLSWNMMETWSTDISNLTSLQYLDLAKNRLEGVPRILRHQIDKIMRNRNDSIHISINGNYLICDCDSLESLEWMLKPTVIIDDLSVNECRFSDGSFVCMCDLKDIVLKLRQQCKTIIPIIFSAAAGLSLFLTVAFAGIFYRYRWKLRYLYYTTRRKYRGYQRMTEDDNFTYDAFVSYADEDRDFVVNDMHTILEDRFGLRLCIHQRDFMVGEPITANIINAIKSSRKTIVILSPDFVESSWCEYEVRMAKLESIHTGRDLLCVVWYADVPDREAITGDLLEEILNDTYIRYPGVEQDREIFWNTLKQSLEY